ncbi:MAG: helix-turn-helix transcriptional regulator [Terracidiphilus sp.]
MRNHNTLRPAGQRPIGTSFSKSKTLSWRPLLGVLSTLAHTLVCDRKTKTGGAAVPEGRNPKLRTYYEGVLSRLIAARVESGLTQRDVSLRLGMAHSFMNKCESGERAIDVAELWALSSLYGKPISYFAPDK